MTATLAPARSFLNLVKIEHSVFALPFAYLSALTALARGPHRVDVGKLVLVTIAMVGARTFAMAANRIIDRHIDARNPRTAGREIPSGQLSTAQVALFCAASLALFLIAVWQLHHLVRWHRLAGKITLPGVTAHSAEDP